MRLLVFGATCLLCIGTFLEIAFHTYGDRAAKPAHFLWGIVVTWTAVLVTTGCLGLLHMYSFAGCMGVLLFVVVCAKVVFFIRCGVPLVSAGWLVDMWKRRKMPRVLSVLAGLVVAGMALLNALYPVGYMNGGRDYGLYIIGAVNMAENGTMQPPPSEFMREHYHELDHAVYLNYSAMYDEYNDGRSDNPGDLQPQFLPVFTSTLALGYDLGGFTWLFRINVIHTFVFVLLFYLLCKRYLGHPGACLGAVFMSVSLANVWGARITQTEQLAGLLFLLSSYCFVECWEKNSVTWAMLGSFFIGFGCFNRLDNYILLIAMYGCAAYCAIWRREKMRAVSVAALFQTVLGTASLWYGVTFHYRYYLNHWRMDVLKQLLVATLAALVVWLLTVAVGYMLKGRKMKSPLEALCQTRWLCVCAAALLCVGAVLDFLRPTFDVGYSALNRYSWYMSYLAVPLAILGVFWFVRGRLWPEKADAAHRLEPLLYFFLSGLGSVVLYTYNPSISVDHYWFSRRWVPVNFPFVFFFAAFALVCLWKWMPRRLVPRIVAAGCAVYMTGYMLYNDQMILTTRLLPQLQNQYEEAAEFIPDDSLVLTSNRTIASVYRFVYKKQVYLANLSFSADGNGVKQLQEYLQNGNALYVLGEISAFWQVGRLEPVHEAMLVGRFVESPSNRLPARYESWQQDTSLYQIVPFVEGEQISFDFLQQQYFLGAATRTENGVEVEDGILFGPYITLGMGSYRLEVDIEGDAQAFELFVTADSGKNRLATFPLVGGTNALDLDIPMIFNEALEEWEYMARDVEFVISRVSEQGQVLVSRVELIVQ